ncbi:N-acetylneuraminate synthase [Paenibacillus sp. SYP-B3998]|uniref:N-acetylneuraminate synthase n=1 Tax=Paenibacillus sp. SYP-B3998 TaxID=2678564 RepID=A0A6G4A226_9BACL|nr:N-acetylneuraminate synthase family protein [Paenibacillus sp. SYP-B3998]NEW08523.1 N-acetylneuraminate synthase [Paenibacillus sp. SYP-B3998]
MMQLWERLSNSAKPYIIAEIAANHNGDRLLAERLIYKAKEAGVDCVKFQSWTKISLMIQSNYDNELERTLDQFSMTEEKLVDMKQLCNQIGIEFACTPFSKREIDFLVQLGVPFIKLSSTELTNIPLLQYAGATGLTIVLSTGMGGSEEIAEAVSVLEQTGNTSIVLLHCVSVYPPKDEHVNLNNLDGLRARYPYPIGFSDHTIGTAIPIAAAAKGARVIEKHFTLDKGLPGWDHQVSATPEEMTQIVTDVGRIQSALGSFDRRLSEEEERNRAFFRRSVVAAREIQAGKVIDYDDLDTKRPGTGLSPRLIGQIVGKAATRTIGFDELLSISDFE